MAASLSQIDIFAMKIYTKTGDQGETKLFGGKKVKKNSKRIQAYGEVDELNAVLGIVSAYLDDSSIKEIILNLQNELFILGGDLASPLDTHAGRKPVPRIKEEMVSALEDLIDKLEEKLPSLDRFILPNGTIAASFIHLARTITRRAERSIVALAEEEEINKTALKYTNRLSDFFFVLARYLNLKDKTKETEVTFPN